MKWYLIVGWFFLVVFLFGCARSSLRHVGSSLPHAGSFSCGMPDLVPWSGIEPMPPALGAQSFFFFLINLFIYLFIYFWLCWVFVSVRGLSLVAASGGQSSSRCAGLSLSQPLLLRGTGSGHAGSVVVAHGPSCSAACGIFPDQGSNPCPLH